MRKSALFAGLAALPLMTVEVSAQTPAQTSATGPSETGTAVAVETCGQMAEQYGFDTEGAEPDGARKLLKSLGQDGNKKVRMRVASAIKGPAAVVCDHNGSAQRYLLVGGDFYKRLNEQRGLAHIVFFAIELARHTQPALKDRAREDQAAQKLAGQMLVQKLNATVLQIRAISDTMVIAGSLVSNPLAAVEAGAAEAAAAVQAAQKRKEAAAEAAETAAEKAADEKAARNRRIASFEVRTGTSISGDGSINGKPTQYLVKSEAECVARFQSEPRAVAAEYLSSGYRDYNCGLFDKPNLQSSNGGNAKVFILNR